jgi:Kef-type K+ transport system membrane component KefB
MLGQALGYIGQPPVIGEVAAGILLGPSFLGWVWPAAAAFVLPPQVAPYLNIIAQLGVILYMFTVGLELDLGRLRDRARATLTISLAGMIVPLLLGMGMARFLYPQFSSEGVAFSTFALFVGVATAVTAFPVLARILTDRELQKTPLGILALGCSAIADVMAWCLLAFAVALAHAAVGSGIGVLAQVLAFVFFMLVIARPIAGWYLRRANDKGPKPEVVAVIFATLLLSALCTEAIGIHAIFGAFLLGVIIPHDSQAARSIARKLEDLVPILFLPAFFAFTGMRTQIGLISGAGDWLLCGLIIVIATVGKLGGTALAARCNHLSWREATALGFLMNTRGLMELIVLSVGLDLKIISPQLFAIMVLMALATTLATGPALQLLGIARPEPKRAQASSLGSVPMMDEDTRAATGQQS